MIFLTFMSSVYPPKVSNHFSQDIERANEENELLKCQIRDTKDVAWSSFKERNEFELELQRMCEYNEKLQTEISDTKNVMWSSFKEV